MASASSGAELGRLDQIAGHQVDHQVPAQQDVVAELAGTVDGLAAKPKPAVGLAGEEVHGGEHTEGIGEQPVVAELASQVNGLVTVLAGRRDINQRSDASDGHQRRPEQSGVGAGSGAVEHGQEQPECFPAARTREPVAAEGDAEAQDPSGPVRVAGGMLGGAAQVRMVGVEPRVPVALVRPGQVRGRRLGQGQEVPAVRRRGGSRCLVPRLDQTFGRELADRLEQPVAEGIAGWLGHHQALVHQGAEKIRGVECVAVTAAAYRFGGVQIEALGEHREQAQQ